MQVNSTESIEYQEYLQRLAAQQAAAQASAEQATTQTAAASFFSQGMDSYVSSSEDTETEMVIPSEQYNEMKPSMNSMRPPMPPMAPPDDDSTTTDETSAAAAETDDTDVSTDSALSLISSTMRVNQDAIEAAMDKLGLTEDDLTDEDSLTELLDELTDGAKQRGLPTADETAIAGLITELTEEGSTATTAETESTVEEA